jgi:hypothetical protein
MWHFQHSMILWCLGLLPWIAAGERPGGTAPRAEVWDMQSARFAIGRSVLGSGGAFRTSSHFQMAGTLGQPQCGEASSHNFRLNAGFWQVETGPVYLPIILK